MNKAYQKLNFVNGQAPDLDAENLNAISTAIDTIDDRVVAHDSRFETAEGNISRLDNNKLDKNNPTITGKLTASVIENEYIKTQGIETDEIEVDSIVANNNYVVFRQDIVVDGINEPIGSLASSASLQAISAENRANSAYTRANDALGDAAVALERTKTNRNNIAITNGLVGKGIGITKTPIKTYDGKYLSSPVGEIKDFGRNGRVIEIDVSGGENIFIDTLDLLILENGAGYVLCAFFDESNNYMLEPENLDIIYEVDESFETIRKYITNSTLAIPESAKYLRFSSTLDGASDVYIQNTLSDAIKELQSKPTPSSLTLTSASPLRTSTASNILGIHAIGKSEQITTQTLDAIQGSIDTNGKINVTVPVTASNRCLSSSVMFLNKGTVITAGSSFNVFVCYSATLDGDISERYSWQTSYAVTKDGYYRVIVKKPNDANITPSEFVLTFTTIPTPTNPIPITDAELEVTAHTKNLVPYTVKNGTFNDVAYTISNDGTVTLNGKASANGTLDFFRSVTEIPSDWEKGKKYIFGAKFINNTNVGDAHFDTYPYINGAWDTSNDVVLNDTSEVEWTIPNNAVGFLCRIGTQGGKTYNNLIIKPYIYEAYNTIALPFSPKSVGSAANELIVYEDGTGKIVKRVSTAIYDGTEANWKQTATDKTFYLQKSDSKLGDIVFPTDSNFKGEGLCSHFEIHARNGIALNQFALTSGYNIMFYHSAQTIDEWKAWLSQNPITVYAVLKTPIETPLTAEEVAAVRQLMTYKGTTIIDSEMQIDSVTYSGDVKGYVDGKTDYSYTDQIIGKWADGKDLHRMVIQTTTPNANADGLISNLINGTNCSIKRISGIIQSSDAVYVPISDYYNSGTFASIWIDAGGIKLRTNTAIYASKPCEIIVEYTLKNTASASVMSLSLDDEGGEE